MFDEKKAMYGTDAEIYINGDKVGQATSFNAEVTATKVDVPMCGVKGTKKKTVGYEGKGTLKLTKINSYLAATIANDIKNGDETVVSIISKVGSAKNGFERIQIKDASFDSVKLADWESKKLMEQEFPFTFSEYVFLDAIK